MKFQKYPSLENHYREKFIDSIKMNPDTYETDWVVTEKIHGANFSFWTDGNEVKVASRSQFVDGSFYNCQSVIDRYSESVKQIFSLVCEFDDPKYIAVYGELHGDGVQKGITYSDEKEFIMFDVAIKREGEEELNFFEYEILEDFSDYSKIALVPTLFQGSFDECLKQENEFDSVIANIENNTAEGTVIRPLEYDLYNHRGQRMIVKSKNSKWSEKQKTKSKNKPQTFTHPLQPTISEYVNVNRMNAVLSKQGGLEALEPKDFGKLLGQVTGDVIEDLVKDEVLPQDWKKDKELKPLSKWINLQVKELLMKEVMPKL